MTDLVADMLTDCMGLHHRCDHVRIQGAVARGAVMTDQGRGDPSANSHTNNTARNHQLESVKARHISAARGTKCSAMSPCRALSSSVGILISCLSD